MPSREIAGDFGLAHSLRQFQASPFLWTLCKVNSQNQSITQKILDFTLKRLIVVNVQTFEITLSFRVLPL